MNARQSLICGSSIVLCLLFATNAQTAIAQATNAQTAIAQATNAYRVGEVIKGKEYNDVLKWWSTRDFSIWVGIDDGGHKLIQFTAETGLGDVSVILDYSITLRNEFGSLIEKAIEWSGVARTNNAETTRALGCFAGVGGADRYYMSECKKTGTPPKRDAMNLG